jgi:hypothetical protein
MTNNEHQFEKSIQLLKQLLKKSKARVQRLELTTGFAAKARSEASIRLEARMSRLDAAMAALAEAQAHADQRLSALINFLRERRKGMS